MKAKLLAAAALCCLVLALAWVSHEDIRLPWASLARYEREFPGCVAGVISDDYSSLKLPTAFRHYYLAWGDAFPAAEMKTGYAAAAILVLTWEPHMGAAGQRGLLAEIASGLHDARMKSLAAAIKAYGRPVMLRWGHEPNGDWYSWSGAANGKSPAEYIRAWRRMAGVMRASAGPRLRLIFSVNGEDKPADKWNRFENYYPGGDYVDAVGLDVYNWGTAREWSSWRRPSLLLKAPYARALAMAPDKPVFLTEVASCSSGGSKAVWLRRLLSRLENRYTAVKGFMWFDYDKECDWRLSSDEAARAYGQAASGGYFKADPARLSWFFGG